MSIRLSRRSWKTAICCTSVLASACRTLPTGQLPEAPHDPADIAALAAGKNLELLVLPEGFVGAVVVIYEQKAGELPVVRGDTLQYQIPVDGILKVALPQPSGRRIIVGYRPSPNAGLRAFPTCYEMRRRLTAANALGVCWLAEIGASNALPHDAFIVSSWEDIPESYNRGMSLLDSVVFNGHFRGGIKWIEPADTQPRQSRRASSLPVQHRDSRSAGKLRFGRHGCGKSSFVKETECYLA